MTAERTVRLLLLTYAFPPTAVPEAIVCAKRFGNIPDTEVDVVTIRPFKSWMGSDASLDRYVSSRFHSVLRLKAGPIARMAPLGRLGSLTKRPDAFRLFNRRLESAARAVITEEHQGIITSSQWHSVHLVGVRLVRETGLPWIAHFSDPWSQNPYTEWGDRTRRVNAELERMVIATADMITVTNAYAREALLQSHPDRSPDTIVVVPHGWDPDLYPPVPTRSPGPLVARHIGSFYGPRTPQPLVAATRMLVDRRPDLARRLQIELVGRIGNIPATDIRNFPGLMRVIPTVPYKTSLELMLGSDLLITVDAPTDRSVFLPSKLVDYVGADRPIVALSPAGPTADLVRSLGGWVANPRDVDASSSALESAIDAIRSQGAPVSTERDAIRQQYEAGEIGRRFSQRLAYIAAR